MGGRAPASPTASRLPAPGVDTGSLALHREGRVTQTELLQGADTPLSSGFAGAGNLSLSLAETTRAKSFSPGVCSVCKSEGWSRSLPALSACAEMLCSSGMFQPQVPLCSRPGVGWDHALVAVLRPLALGPSGQHWVETSRTSPDLGDLERSWETGENCRVVCSDSRC